MSDKTKKPTQLIKKMTGFINKLVEKAGFELVEAGAFKDYDGDTCWEAHIQPVESLRSLATMRFKVSRQGHIVIGNSPQRPSPGEWIAYGTQIKCDFAADNSLEEKIATFVQRTIARIGPLDRLAAAAPNTNVK